MEGIFMASSDVRKIVEKIIEAHGGASRWHKLEAVEAVISVRGFLFKAKRRPILNRVRIRASTREPKFTFYVYLLRRLDYTAKVVSRWAHAAHICEN